MGAVRRQGQGRVGRREQQVIHPDTVLSRVTLPGHWQGDPIGIQFPETGLGLAQIGRQNMARGRKTKKAPQKVGMYLGPTEKTHGYSWTGTRRHGNKRGADTKGQWQDSDGGHAGAWSQSAGYYCPVERDARYAATVSS